MLKEIEELIKQKNWPTEWIKMGFSQNIMLNYWNKINVPEDWKDHPEKCWLWITGKGGNGQVYGTFTIKSKTYHKSFRSNRFMYENCYGPIPNGILVCHHCDDPSCCNPLHLFLGTNQDNTTDMISKGRNIIVVGSDVGTSILIEENIVDIITNTLNGIYKNQQQILQKYGISDTELRRIINGKRWTHVTNQFSKAQLLQVKKLLTGLCANKLNENLVHLIKQDLKNNIKVTIIAKKFNISVANVYLIKNGQIWAKVI